MRRLARLLLLSLVVMLMAGPAFAVDKPRRIVAPPPTPAVGLRGSLDAPAAPLPSLQTQAVALPAPGLSFIGVGSAGLSAPPPVTPLRSVGDPAPICRATCAETRIVCASSDDMGCDSRWTQCVADCSAPLDR